MSGRLSRLAGAAVAAAVVASLALVGSAQADPIGDKIAAATASLQALQQKLDVAAEQLDQAQIAVDGAQHNADLAEQRVAAAQASLDAARSNLGRVAAMAYQTGGTDVLGLLVSGDPASYLDRASTLDQISRTQSDALREVGQAAKKLKEQKLQAAQAVSDAQATARTLASVKQTITDEVSAQDKTVADLKAQQAELIRQAQEAAARAAAAAAARQAAAAKAAADAAAAARARAAAIQAALNPAPVATPAPAPAAPAAPARPAAPAAPAPSGGAAAAVAAARSVLGAPYVFAGSGPNVFDCSGLTMWAWAHAGVYLPHSAAAQFSSGTRIPLSQLQPGDLVFYGFGYIHHVGLYIGGGMMIHAPHTGSVVSIAPITIESDLAGAARV